MSEDLVSDDLLDEIMVGGAGLGGDPTEAPKKKMRVAAGSNPLLMRLRLGTLLVIGHKYYPDALSRVTNIQCGIFSLFDAVRLKGDAWMERPPLPRHPTGSRYYAIKELYRKASENPDRRFGGLPEAYAKPCMYFGIKTFTERYKSLSQSILSEGRKEYQESIQENPVHQGTMRSEDLNVPKPSLLEEVTGRKPRRRE